MRGWLAWLWGKKRSRKRSRSAGEDNWADILTGTVRKALAGAGSKREQEAIDPSELEERAQSLEALADMLRNKPEQLGFKVAPRAIEGRDIEAQWEAGGDGDGDVTPVKGRRDVGSSFADGVRCAYESVFRGQGAYPQSNHRLSPSPGRDNVVHCVARRPPFGRVWFLVIPRPSLRLRGGRGDRGIFYKIAVASALESLIRA